MSAEREILQIVTAPDGWRAAFAAYDRAHPLRFSPLVCWVLVEQHTKFEDDPECVGRCVVGLVVDGDRNLSYCDESPTFLGYMPPGADSDDLEYKALRFWEEKALKGELPWPPRE